jgi:GntR family transcriptional regulator, transcriptional repressor for pyruvate dehydrogenase complex
VKKFSKIKKDRNLYEDVLKELKRAIIAGTYSTGSLLPGEIELAKQFGVSRPVVREALRSLQSNGFVEIRRGIKGGAFVRDSLRLPLFDDFASFIRYRRYRVDHLTQARLLVEPEVCRLAAKNATRAEIQEMRDLVNHYSEVVDPDEKDVLYSLFHRLVGRSCGNPIYAVLIENIMDFTEGFIRTIKPVTQLIHEDHDHDEILNALENRDPERAAEFAAQHARHIQQGMRKLEAIYLELLEEEEIQPARATMG